MVSPAVEQSGSRRGLTPRQWRVLTTAIWTISLFCLIVGGLLAAEFVLMPVSLDLNEIMDAGAQPWRDAILAALAFLALLLLNAAGLRLWHTARFRKIAWALTAVQVVAVGWAGFIVFRDYF